MRLSISPASIALLVGLSLSAPSSPSEAQSLPDALSGPANKAVSLGNWKTVTAPASPAGTFDHWQANIIIAKPAFAKSKQPAATPLGERPYALHGPDPAGAGHALTGIASFYGKGERTATGEAFNPQDLTAAHRTLPFGTRVRVTRLDSGDSVVVRINDRGPFKPGRVIDLSTKAAENLGMTGKGLADVKLEVLGREDGPKPENVAQRSVRR
ncbi:septal ring lytic transglycosylase RlpA family protein [Hyphomicrobium sp.]|uniref:septal ring lytic transglycosylase RlpA family protein n=1 Tax=Hyphomicrobium sp. TaxID=82 RepID=UPI0025BB1EF6|nr:septal ring lytic transglycosylase RlpA family protein [Hyphomicrobium sp.]